MFIKCMPKFALYLSEIKKKVLELKDDTRGAEFIQVLLLILIVILAGGIILNILRVATPDFVNDIITRIRDVFEL